MASAKTPKRLELFRALAIPLVWPKPPEQSRRPTPKHSQTLLFKPLTISLDTAAKNPVKAVLTRRKESAEVSLAKGCDRAMRLNQPQNDHPHPSKTTPPTPRNHPATTRVDDLIRSSVAEIESTCDHQGVVIELDLTPIIAESQAEFIRDTTQCLLRNALQAMPHGGELSISVIDTPTHWELEVADSGSNPSFSKLPHCPTEDFEQLQNSDNSLPVVLSFTAHQDLARADILATQHNATLQSWPCPLGGKAHVLMVPKRNRQSSSDPSISEVGQFLPVHPSSPRSSIRRAS